MAAPLDLQPKWGAEGRRYYPFKRCQILGKYEIGKKIGKGTFGEVYCGTGQDTVALKKVMMENETEGYPITALRELKILKRLKHTNVIRLREIVVEPSDLEDIHNRGFMYMVFDYMQHDLCGLLRAGTKFRVEEIMCLSKQFLGGLHYLHCCKIVHRDLKAANILINSKGELHIADFGLARYLDPVQQQQYTRTVCTRWYRAPEILLGEISYTNSIDLWAAGCIIAEMFYGDPIFKSNVPNGDDKQNDLEQYVLICKLCGTPDETVWPGFSKLPCDNFAAPKVQHQRSLKSWCHKEFQAGKNAGINAGIDLIDKLLQLDPSARPSCHLALDHEFFWTNPQPCLPSAIVLPKESCHDMNVRPPPPTGRAGASALPGGRKPRGKHE